MLNLIGWGVLLPIGKVVARYCKHWDPAWFYAHIFLQGGGFVLGLAGVITGFRLEDKVSDDVDTHKAIGIFILVSGSLQVSNLPSITLSDPPLMAVSELPSSPR